MPSREARARLLTPSFLVVVAALGCDDGERQPQPLPWSTDTAGATGGGSGGATSAGSAGTTSGASAGTNAASCPTAAPTGGEACAEPQTCRYLSPDCMSVTATCEQGAWETSQYLSPACNPPQPSDLQCGPPTNGLCPPGKAVQLARKVDAAAACLGEPQPFVCSVSASSEATCWISPVDGSTYLLSVSPSCPNYTDVMPCSPDERLAAEELADCTAP